MTVANALHHVHDVDDMRNLARRRLPHGVFEFIDRGTEADVALRGNAEALTRVRLLPRPLVNVSARSAEALLLGTSQAMPLAIAPTGVAGLVWFQGEVALARAAAAAGVPFTLATRAMSAMETVAHEAGGTLWFQLYPTRDETLSAKLMERAAGAGFRALVVTVDTPAVPLRVYNERNGFALSFRLTSRFAADVLCHPRWLAGTIGRYVRNGGMPRFENLPGRPSVMAGAPTSAMLDGTCDWEMLERLRDRWQGKFLVKGILRPEDAVRAVRLGADGVIVSNHGGRNLDCAPAPMDMLPGVVAAADGLAEVYVDGGFRRGSDIAKALALGATGVLSGRATLYGAAAAGEAGARHVLDLLHKELLTTMAMLGCARIADLPHAAMPVQQ